MEKQGKKIKEIINEVFTSKIIEINDIDFYEVINSKFNNFFSGFLLNIIVDSIKNHIILPILNQKNLQILLENEYFNNLIMNQFDKDTFRINPKPKQMINSYKISFFNGFILPKSKFILDNITKYIKEEISNRYFINEENIRKLNIKNANKNKRNIIKKYTNELDRIKENVKVEMFKEDYFEAIFNQSNIYFKEFLLKDYLTYFIIKCFEKYEKNNKNNEKLINFLQIILKLKLQRGNISSAKFDNTLDEFIEIMLFTQGYSKDLFNIFLIFLDLSKFFNNFDGMISQILQENIIKDEISERNNEYIKLVNYHWFLILESLTRAILIYSIELFMNDNNKFYDYFRLFGAIETSLQKLNNKYYLHSKEIFNLRSILKIQEAYKYNYDKFENYYKNIVNNLLQQTLCLYNNDYRNYYKLTSDLKKIFDKSFHEKTEEYINLLSFIFFQQYKALPDEETKIKLIEDFFKNPFLIKKSKILLVETLKDMQPEISKKDEDIFLNLEENPLFFKYRKLFEIYNNIESLEFDELLLFTFENQCQAYFQKIFKNYDRKNNKALYKDLLLENSLDKFIKALKYLSDHKGQFNKLLKFSSIAYIKTYIHFYVEINYHYKKLCDFSQINNVLNDENDNNKLIRTVRNIYLWRVYFRQFENFEQFKNLNYKSHKIPIFKELLDKLSKENNINNNYIFTESFINPVKFNEIKIIETEIFSNKNNFEFNFDEINQSLDILYCALVNKVLSNLYSNNKEAYKEKLKNIYATTKNGIEFKEEGKKLYKYLMNNELFEKNIVQKISEKPLTQEEFEILLYSFRFVLNIQTKENENFYSNLLKANASKFINNNYIPGSFPVFNEYIKSYNSLKVAFTKIEKLGYYICKDCGYLYYVPPCTLPMTEGKCPNGHVIGGHNERCSKKDIRVFPNLEALRRGKTNGSLVPITLEEFKNNYVDKHKPQREKGIVQGFRDIDFVRKQYLSDLNIITFRTLNFILYSFILSAYILNNISKTETNQYLVENLFPHTLFGIIKKGWKLLNDNLKEIGIESVKVFFNVIFDKLMVFMYNLDSCDTREKLENFEKNVNDLILTQIGRAKEINQEYNKLNNELINFNPNNIKEIIINSYEPSLYSQEKYPDIQYYCVSNIYNLDTFTQAFNSLGENKKKYSLINLLINKEGDSTKNVLNMKYLKNINKLINLLIKMYSYKISREDAKKKIFQDELPSIVKTFNERNNIKITKEKFIEEYINPFLESWNIIKTGAVQYKCRILRDLERGEKPLDIKMDNPLYNFLVDDGDKDGGMFLAAAYENFISWQNQFIDYIISNNNFGGILNSYISQLEIEINVQDAVDSEIINIDENIYDTLDNFISSYSMRNIFDINGKQIYYKNYNDIIYNYDLIEEELGKLILPGIKKFKNNNIEFITYLFKGFRGQKSSILVDYNIKYKRQELTEEEKDFINKTLKNINNDKKIYNDIFSSLQILMNEILKENYNQNHLIYDIINNIPKYVILNEHLINLINIKYVQSENNNSFTVNSLVSIFEYFEDLCWEDIQKYIPLDFQIPIDDEIGIKIYRYLIPNKKGKKKIIDKNILIIALKKLISRYIVGTRQDIDINPESELKFNITKEEFWPQNFIDNDSFDIEIEEIFKHKIITGQSFNFYTLLNIDENEIKKREELIEKNKKELENKNIKSIVGINSESNKKTDVNPKTENIVGGGSKDSRNKISLKSSSFENETNSSKRFNETQESEPAIIPIDKKDTNEEISFCKKFIDCIKSSCNIF